MNTIMDLWKLVLTDLEEDLSAIAIATWFDEITPVKMAAAELWLYCPNSFKRSNIERFYLEAIRKAAAILKKGVPVWIRVEFAT